MLGPSKDLNPQTGTSLRYRAEIDGLRAIAVLPVILFHAGFEVFGGGFVGVDVFFVISGYLITRIIVDELARDRFSLLGFYARRARRILPALFVVLIVCIPFAWLWMLPDDLKQFALGLVAVVTFWSNILFWLESGYFASANELNPLFHTWSLAVEEQYYIVFPLLLMALWRFGTHRMLANLAIIFFLSLGVAQWAVHTHPTAAFYLLPTRGWELLAGVFTAFFLRYQSAERTASIAVQVASAIGIGLIGYAVFVFDEQTPFPSVYTVVPVLGTCLIILFAVKGTFVHKVLGSRMLVGLGLVSYSAYLWHQPLFAFTRYRSISAPSEATMLALCAITFILAYFSWRFVETPFRSRTRFDLKKTAVVTGVLLSGFLTTGFLTQAGSLKSLYEIENPRYNLDFGGSASVGSECAGFEVVEGKALCSLHGTGDDLYVLWGDSHAAVLGRQIPTDMLANENVRIMVITHSGCPPLIGVVRADGIGNAENCSSFGTMFRYAKFIADHSPRKVILGARWSMYINGLHGQGNLQEMTHFVNTETAIGNNSEASRRAFEMGLVDTVSFLNELDVAVIGQAPDLQHHTIRERRLYQTVNRLPIDAWHAAESEVFSRNLPAGERYFSLRDALCDASECLLYDDGRPLYKDDNHLDGWGLVLAWRYLQAEILAPE